VWKIPSRKERGRGVNALEVGKVLGVYYLDGIYLKGKRGARRNALEHGE